MMKSYSNDPINDPLNSWADPNDLEVEKEPTPLETMIKEMIGVENLEIKTDLTDNMIVAMTKGNIYAKRYKNDLMSSLITTISKYRISRNRKGRDDIKEMAKGLGGYANEGGSTFMSRLFKGE